MKLTISLTVAVCFFGATLFAQDDDARVSSKERVKWTSSKVSGTPDPPSPYRVRVAFPNIKLTDPLAMTLIPSSNRLAVAEQKGKIKWFSADRKTSEVTQILDLQRQTMGLAFHPKFQDNGYFYVTYIEKGDDPKGTRVSRFRADPTSVKVDRSSEKILIEWPSGGHNGGCLKFGPDGHLYICTGDSSGIADLKLTGQDITNVSGAILRIDVDSKSPYAIPSDNPFVDVEGARGEIYAYGLRQPWKISFDTKTGDLWCGNVGQDLWEQIYLIKKGGNYGWSVLEGSFPFRPERKRGPTPFEMPLAEHDHAAFRSITGGFVYHGNSLPKLKGAYIYGDYDTGKIWMLRYDRNQKRVVSNSELLDSTLRLVGFAVDHQEELLLIDHMTGKISELIPNTQADTSRLFPRQLSQTGLFQDVSKHVVASGVIPYSVNAPQWVDGATKQRYMALPGNGKIEFDGITYPQPAPGAPHGWKFPDGTVLFETIGMELEKGNPESFMRIETRVLHYEKLEGTESVGDQYWRGYTYVWNKEQTDARLLEDPQGKEARFPLKGHRTKEIVWRFPSRAECTVCHNMAAKYALGANTLQLNRSHAFADGQHNQLEAYKRLGLFSNPPKESSADLPKLASYMDDDESIENRARAYLHANCSHCHRKWGGGNGEMLLLASIAEKAMLVRGEKPQHGGFFIPQAKVVAAGSPEASTLFYRMAKLGPGHMPRLGANEIDPVGLKLVHDWISQMRPAGSATAAVRKKVEQLSMRQGQSLNQAIDELLSSTSGAIELAKLDLHATPKLKAAVLERAGKHSGSHIRDLFERFRSPGERTKRLGTAINRAALLAISGDVNRGRQLFAKAADLQCRNCHKVKDIGKDVGPDLSHIGKKLDRARILDSILYPSREVDPKFRVHLVQTSKGRVLTGILVSKSANKIVLKNEKNEVREIDANDVENLVPQQQSMMPDLLARDMTAQQLADLIAFLNSLK